MSVFDRTVKLLRGALEDAYYDGVKGGKKPDDAAAITLTHRLVEVAMKEVRDRG